ERRKARRIESKQTIEYLAQVQHIRDLKYKDRLLRMN
ncbi:hypothetical protein QUC64_06100, partial [Staphylococcus aureus]